MRAAVARVIGDGDSEAVGPVVVGIRRIGPLPRRGIDARGPVRGRPRHAVDAAVAQALAIGRGQGPGERRVFGPGPARAPRHHGRIVHRGHRQRHRLGRARRGPVVGHHGDRAVARGRCVARVVVLNTLQDRLIHHLGRQAGDREHPGAGRVTDGEAGPGGRGGGRGVQRQRFHRIAVRACGERDRQRTEVGRIHIGQGPHRRDQDRRLLRERHGHILPRPARVQIHHRRIINRRHGEQDKLAGRIDPTIGRTTRVVDIELKGRDSARVGRRFELHALDVG